MGAAVLEGLIAASPCVGVKLPRVPVGDPTIVTPEQVATLAAIMPEPYGLLVDVMAYAGLRLGETFALRRRSVDVLRSRLVVSESLSDANGDLTFQAPKSHQRRTVTLPAFLLAKVSAHLEERVGANPDDLLFLSPDGGLLRAGNYHRRIWHPACQAAGLTGVTPHDLRASHATWLVDGGWSVMDVAARLGHSKATVTTRHYARTVEGRDQELATGLDALHGGVSGADRARSGHAIFTAAQAARAN
jgi:integrase